MDSTNKTFTKRLAALFLCAAFFAANAAAAFSIGDDFFKTDEIDESIQRELVIFHSMANLNLNPHTKRRLRRPFFLQRRDAGTGQRARPRL